MFTFLKAAPVAALSLTLVAAANFSDAGFAFGAENAAATLTPETIQVDPQQLAADTHAAEAATNSDAAFAPSTAAADEALKPIDTAVEAGAIPQASSLAEMVQKMGFPSALDAQTKCLATAVYFEAKSESLDGQLAVAHVVIARSKSGRFASTYCGVVYQKSQFSFVRGGNRVPHIDTSSGQWRNAVAIARIAMADAWKSPVEGALFFHATYVSPGWKLKRIGRVENHIFYR